MLIGIVIASMGAIVMHAGEAYAGGCEVKEVTVKGQVIRVQLCGAVKNRSGRVIHITTILEPDRSNSASDWCDVWNWKGGPGKSWRHAGCKQLSRGGEGGTFGGNGTGYDVDAFTFANHGYHVRHSRVGKWHWEKKGVWTKVRSGEIADCGIGDNNAVWCTVLWQVL